MSRWPLFSERGAEDLPWDVAAVISQRRYNLYVEQTIRFHKDYPAPTPRTKRSVNGFADWLKWIDSERDLQRTLSVDQYVHPNDLPFRARNCVLAFDHKWWRRHGATVVFWHTKHLKAYHPDQIEGIDRDAIKREQAAEKMVTREFTVFQ